MSYAELHCHSYYSFHDGASSLEELLLRAKELGYQALALTDHDNLCGAMRFAKLTASLEMQGIIGAEITLKGGYHLTLLAKDSTGYKNLSRLITAAHQAGELNEPALPTELLAEHATGLIALSGCPKGELAQLLTGAHVTEAKSLIRRYMEWFGSDNYYLELQRNLVFGESGRNKKLLELSAELGVKIAATGNVHYHIRERHQLQDCLVSIRNCKSLEETHRRAPPKFRVLPPAGAGTGGAFPGLSRSFRQYPANCRTLHTGPDQRPQLQLPRLSRAGAFDSLEPNRRNARWEIGLRYRPINSQLSLPLPVAQDMAELENPDDWERMQGE